MHPTLLVSAPGRVQASTALQLQLSSGQRAASERTRQQLDGAEKRPTVKGTIERAHPKLTAATESETAAMHASTTTTDCKSYYETEKVEKRKKIERSFCVLERSPSARRQIAFSQLLSHAAFPFPVRFT